MPLTDEQREAVETVFRHRVFMRDFQDMLSECDPLSHVAFMYVGDHIDFAVHKVLVEKNVGSVQTVIFRATQEEVSEHNDTESLRELVASARRGGRVAVMVVTEGTNTIIGHQVEFSGPKGELRS